MSWWSTWRSQQAAKANELAATEQPDVQAAAQATRERDWSAIVTDYNEGRISAAEMGRQQDGRLAQIGAEAAWEEMLLAPQADLGDTEINRIDAEREQAERDAFEAEPEMEAGA